MDDEFSWFAAIPRALVAAGIAAIGYVFTLYALSPHDPIRGRLVANELFNYIALGMAVLIFGAVFWRLMQGGRMGDEMDKLGDLDID